MNKRMDFSRFPRRALPTYETLFVEEDGSRDLYVLLSGSLGVYRNEVLVATLNDPLSIVGEISALTGSPRAATVRAVEPSTLLVIADPDRLFEEYPQLGAKLARLLATRLANMNERFVELKSLVARGAAGNEIPAPVASADEEEPTTLALTPQPGMSVVPGFPIPPALAADSTSMASGSMPRRRASDWSPEMLEALSDLLDLGPDLVAGT